MTTLAPPLPPKVPAPPRRFAWRRLLVRTFWIGVCVSVGVTLWALWYVNNRGFTKKWRLMLAGELDKRGVHADIGRLNLNPLKGLIARNVRIVHARERDRVLAYIDEIVLDINYSKLVYGEPFINAIDLREASLSLPLNPKDRKSERLEINGLNARVLLPPNQLYIAQAEADVHGLHVSATGRLVNPGSFATMSDDSRGRENVLVIAHDTLRKLNDLKIAGGRPSLEIQFNGDLANPASLFAEAVLRSGRFTVGESYSVRSAQVIATYRDGLIRLSQCAVADSQGEFDASGTFRPETREASLQLRSTLDLLALARGLRLTQKAEELVFYSPPTLELSGEAVFRSEAEGGLRAKLLGRFSVERFGAKSVIFDGASADFSWDGERWFVRDARLSHRSGAVMFSGLRTPGEFRFSLDSRIDPKALQPLLPATAVKILDEWVFDSPPVFQFEGSAPDFSFTGLKADGHFSLGRTRFRKVWLSSLTSSVHLKDKVLTFPDFKLQRPEGKGSGAFAFDIEKGMATLTGVKSTMIPSDVGVWVDRDGNLPRNLLPYRFKGRPPQLSIDGTVGVHDQHHLTRLRIDFEGQGMDYTFLKKDLFFPKVKGVLWIVGERLKIEHVEGTVFGGQLRGSADISLRRGHADYTAQAHVEEIDFPSLTKLYFDYDTSKGKLRGDYRFSGRGDVARTITGEGHLTVSDGNVFGIPLFGPFSGILDQILPGTGFNIARKASAGFTMKEGVIETGDLLVEGKGFSMFGAGKLYFLEDKIDFSIRINAQGAAGVLLTPVSHLLEYVSDGSLAKPVWRPKRLPKGMFQQ